MCRCASCQRSALRRIATFTIDCRRKPTPLDVADTSVTTTVSTMLSWASPPYTAAASYWCQLRNPREQAEYQISAWARRLKVQNGSTGDGDWHIEITGTKTSAVTKCIVIEIPPDTLNPAYFHARQDFLATITNAGSTLNGLET
jgi:hypothetical protein